MTTSTKAKPSGSYEELRRNISNALQNTLENNKDSYIDGTFPDHIVADIYTYDPVTGGGTEETFKIPYTTDNNVDFTFGDPTPVREQTNYVAKSEVFVTKNAAKREVTGPVAIPNCPDCDFLRGEKMFTEDEIGYMMQVYDSNFKNADEMHIFGKTGETIGQSIKNWQLKEAKTLKNINSETVTLPKGTWMSTVKVTDDDTWSRIENGTLRGFSAHYMSKNDAEKLQAVKRTLVKDLTDPVPVSIAVVDRPCVFDAIFTSIKSEHAATKAGRSISNSTLDKINKAYDTAKSSLDNLKSLINKAETERTNNATKSEELDVDEKEMKEAMKEAVKSEVEPLKDEITSLKGEIADLKSEKSEEEEKEESSEKSEEKKEKEVEKKKPEKSEKSEGNGLKGQDGQGEHKEATKSVYEASGRDALGIKRQTRG